MFEQIQEPAAKKRTDYSGVIIVALLLPVLLFFIYPGKQDMGLSVCIVLGMIVLAIRIRWDLRKRLWFWAIIVLMLLLRVPMVIVVRWPQGWTPAVGLLPIGVADCLIILGVVRLVEKFIISVWE